MHAVDFTRVFGIGPRHLPPKQQLCVLGMKIMTNNPLGHAYRTKCVP